jgi:hypothetical protein
VAFFDQAKRPSTVISKTPPPVFFRLTLADGCLFTIWFRAAIARGSYPHIPQYSISI